MKTNSGRAALSPLFALLSLALWSPLVKASGQAGETGAKPFTAPGEINTSEYCLNARNFGALGDGKADDTAALQAAINAAKLAKKSLLLPSGNYLVTKSLDCTFANSPMASFWIIGEGLGLSVITGNLTEPYPILDMSGNTRGGIRSLGVVANSGQATCCVYSAKPTVGGGLGNFFGVTNCRLELYSNGTGDINQAALVLYNTDLSYVRDSEIYGPRALVVGFERPAKIVSKYQTDPHRPDSTMFNLQNSIFNSWAGPAVEYTGGSSIGIDGCYMAVIGTGYRSIFQVSGSGGKTIYARNLRTENQSSFRGLSAIRFLSESNQGEITGCLETGPADFVIDAAAAISRYRLNILNSLGTVFATNSILHGLELVTNNKNLGLLSDKSYEVRANGTAVKK